MADRDKPAAWVTIELPFAMAQSTSASLIEWAVPGLREEMIAELLRALPKAIRKELMPFPPKVSEIVRDFQPSGKSFLHDLASFIHKRYGVEIPVSAWPANALPAHLRPRINILDHNRKSLGSGRDLAQLQQTLQPAPAKPSPKSDSAEWTRAAEKWERFGVTEWAWGDLPERITISEGPGHSLYAWPGLEFAEGVVNLRLFRSADLARNQSLTGVQRLVELAIQKDLAWLEKDLRALSRYDALYSPIGDSAELRETALEHLKRYLFPAEPLPALTQKDFQAAVATARERLPGLAQQFIDRLGPILQLRQQVQQKIGTPVPTTTTKPRPQTLSSFSQIGTTAPKPASPAAANPLTDELNHLMPSRFLDRIDYDRLTHLPRYLKALLLRAERATLNPAKNQERLRQLAPYVEALKQLEAEPIRSTEQRTQLNTYRWMVEEYKVSLFAQELGTAIPVSSKRLDAQLASMR
jgi:ATP-dependent helicase HrpA